jgi:membrane associated rhomboid family serine protease
VTAIENDGGGTVSKTSGLVASVYGIIVGLIALFWAVELIDSVVLDDRLQRNGIRPRRADGIDGILWAPFLHVGWRHLISNTVPFIVLGGLVAVRGRRRWVIVTATVALLGGGLTWLFGGGGNHIGASGVVFGYLGALIGAAVFERRPASIAPALVAVMLYGGFILGFVPRSGVSWEGHLFGAIAGLAAAKTLAEPRSATPEPTDDELFDFGDYS